jgi:hypothetical protein
VRRGLQRIKLGVIVSEAADRVHTVFFATLRMTKVGGIVLVLLLLLLLGLNGANAWHAGLPWGLRGGAEAGAGSKV